jgi:RDD family
MTAQNSKKILWITLVSGFIGMIKDLPFFQEGTGGFETRLWAECFSLVQLSLPFSRSMESSLQIGEKLIFINYANLVFYFLLFLGGIFFGLSKNKEARLIRFCFSIVFLYQVIFLLISLRPFLFYISDLKKAGIKWWLIWGLFLLLRLFYLYLSWWIITSITKSRQLQLTTVKADTGDATFLTEASKLQRFWHWMLDTIIFILLISWLVEITRINFWRSLGRSSEAGYVALLLFVVLRMLYYIIYEAVFGATPAKFLTETRVTNNEGGRNKFPAILVRTVSRIIPFEPFSFFWNAKWHDSLSNSFVLKEERTGYKAVFYLWLLPFFLMTGFGIYFGYSSYKKNESRKQYKKELEQKTDALKSRYQHLSTNDIIVTKADGSYHNEYLKVEEIKPSSIIVAKIKMNGNDYSIQQATLRKVYLQQKDSLERIEIFKEEIDKALAAAFNFDAYRKNEHYHYSNLLRNGIQYELQNIMRLYGPVLETNINAWQQDFAGDQYSMLFNFSNVGGMCRLIEIKNTAGDIKWNLPLPMALSRENYPFREFKIKGYELKQDTSYQFILVLEDELLNKYKYLVEGKDSHFKLREIYD